ncbi:hypothetical protein CHLRE_03g148350v5 [Chlamydomonas reinhardtii]|uniref:Uncharacterized protein n=1 Tax=Chlamydomonas reinhardtii TaxID=3055 RepID=A0A2K3DVI6_CHLRE|nr:uncharacterized protein CHLRE_03g148350v5 [Chlamydomonas reinhardtii]PNW84551.1 hypothetical protein CHLRE_03g148350v5 [Chlamydomonas reinhardtii]
MMASALPVRGLAAASSVLTAPSTIGVCACRQPRCQVVTTATLRLAAPSPESLSFTRSISISSSGCSTSYLPLPGRRTGLSGRRGRAASLVCRASFLPDAVDATFRNIITISAVVGISYALILGAATPEPPTPPPLAPGQKALGPGASRGAGSSSSSSGGAGEDNFVWGLMGFISCLPLFGWLSWALAAISDEDRAALYGLYAVLYGSPLLLRGLEWNDPWAITMLVLCVAHVQAERIAQTEPQTLRAIQPVAAVARLLRGAVGGTGSLLSGLGGVLAQDAKRVTRRPGGRSDSSSGPAALGSGDDRLQLDRDPDLVTRGGPIQDPRLDPTRDPELEDYAARELRQFDEQLRAAAEERRRQQRDQR